MSDRPPRLKDIAEACGVSAMTVSKALRGEKKVAAATREKILKEAERIGYRPDPVTSRLMARLRWRREGASDPGSVLAWLDPLGTRPYPAHQRFRARLLEGAEERAERLGYRIERFPLEVEGMPVKRLASILENRGIEAVVVPPLPAGRRSSDFDFRAFASGAVGFSMESPRINRVAFNEFSAVNRCLQKATERGFRRPGFCYRMSQEQPVVRHAVGAWHGWFALEGKSPEVPVLMGESIDEKTFARWLREYRPDVVIANARFTGKGAPPQLAINLARREDRGEGLVRDWATLGAAAVDMVVAQLQRNESGVGEERKTMLLGGRWKGA